MEERLIVSSIDTPTTAILRFRDLVTGPGQTIQHHRQLITDKNAVWWGWWNKYGEAIPTALFIRLANLAQSDKLQLILFDSGRLMTYSARCQDIRWDSKHQKMESPDKDSTPAYYRDTKYLAWFKLTDIQEEKPECLSSYTYVQVDEFFETKESKFRAFYDKRVYNPEELRQQDRTIWFVREFQTGDHTHLVELLDSAKITPSDFPKEFIVSPSRRLLWVSDLHFGEHHGFPPIPEVDRSNLGQAIENALGLVTDYGGLLVSGDITWKADPSEFQLARDFFRRISSSPTRLSNYSILPCPGNHDLAFTAKPATKDAKIDKVPSVARKAYEDFYEGLFYKRPNAHLSCGRKFLLGGCIPVEVVSLNSSLLDQKKGWFQGHGFVGDDQLRTAEKEIGWKVTDEPEPQAFRIVMLHHHIMPVTFREAPKGGNPYSVVLDAEALTHWVVQHRVNLVLHGHMHNPFVACVERPRNGDPKNKWHRFHVAGLQSTGVDKSHRESENAFGVLTFSDQCVEIQWLKVCPQGTSEILWSHSIPLGGGR